MTPGSWERVPSDGVALGLVPEEGAWTLAPGGALDSAASLTALGFPSPLLPTARVSAARLVFPEPGRVHGELTLPRCPLDGGLALDDVRAALDVREGELAIEVDATLTLGEGEAHEQLVSVTGRYGHSAGFSELRLEAWSARPLPLGALLDALASDLGLALPDPIATLTLSHCRVGFDLLRTRDGGTARIERTLRAQARVGSTSGPWEVIPGVLTLEPSDVALGVDGARPFIDLGQRLWLFGVPWDLRMQLPSRVGSATLAEGADLSLEGLFGHFGLHDPGGLSALRIARASLHVDARVGHVALACGVDDAWHGEHFSIESVGLAVSYRTGEGGGLGAQVTGRVRVGGATLRVEAAHAGPGLGWRFAGEVAFAPGAAPTVGALVQELGLGGEVPLAALTLTGLTLGYDTLSGAMRLGCSGALAHGTVLLELDVSRGATRQVRFGGHLLLGDARFDLLFAKDGRGTTLVAAGSGGRPLTSGQLLDALGVEGAGALPGLEVSRALVVIERAAADRTLLAADLAVHADFSGLRALPVLGDALPAAVALSLDLHAVYARGFGAGLDAATAALVPASATSLPTPLPDGLALAATLRVGDRRVELPGAAQRSLAQGATARAPAGRPLPPAPSPPSGAAPAWTDAQVSLGGVVFVRRVGLALDGRVVTVHVDGSLTLAALTLDLIGLALSYDLGSHDVGFALSGLGFGLRKDTLSVVAGFLNVDGDFVGKALVRTSAFGLSAVGGLATVGGAPSLFVYGALDYPLGGPPFFFVQGLSAGFAVNRHLRLPAIAELESFPLVQDVLAPGPAATGGFQAQLERLHDAISPSTGEHFLAVGLKFDTFKQLQGFGLAVVAIDTRQPGITATLVGVATWSTPTPPQVAPSAATMAWVRLNLLASVSSADASVLVQAQLAPGSFVQSAACHLRGGVAAGFWFAGEHAGDFVVSVGGYHPAFTRPPHYPAPAPVGMDWQVASNIRVSGSLYYAITPQALMFGVAFAAVWDAGPLTAWFSLALDFRLDFRPLHFDAAGHIEVGACLSTWFGDVSVSAGATLHLWGPPFSGEAHAHLGPFSVSLRFGEDAPTPPPLTRAEFIDAFLPVAHDDCVSVSPVAGVIAQRADGWTITAKELRLRVESLLPVAEVVLGGGAAPLGKADTALRVPPMRADVGAARMELALTLDGEDASALFGGDLVATLVVKPFPSALWADLSAPGAASSRLAAGVELRVSPPVEGRATDIARHALGHDVRHAALLRGAGRALARVSGDRSRYERQVDRDDAAGVLADPLGARAATLAALAAGLGDAALDPALVHLDPAAAARSFLVAPHLATRVAS